MRGFTRLIRRRPTTAQLALGCSVLALSMSATGIGPADAARAVKRALNADAVDGISASRTPAPGKLLPLDAEGRFPAGVVPAGARGPRGPAGPSVDGPAGGDLQGSFPNPTVRVGAITSDEVGAVAAFRAHAVADQGTPNGGSMTVLLGGEDFDVGNVFDPGSSTFTAPVAGFYQLSASIQMAPGAVRFFPQLNASRSGQTIRGTDMIGSGAPSQLVAAGLMRLERGDTVAVSLYTSSPTTVLRSLDLTMFSGVLVARAA